MILDAGILDMLGYLTAWVTSPVAAVRGAGVATMTRTSIMQP